MATRKEPAKKSKQDVPQHKGLGCIFWLAFILLVVSLFLLNKSIIQKNFSTFLDTFKKTDQADSPTRAPTQDSPAPEAVPAAPIQPVAPAPVKKLAPIAVETPPAPEPAVSTSAPVPVKSRPESSTAVTPTKPVSGTGAAASDTATAPASPSKDTRTRTLWLVRLDSDGTLSRTKVSRKLPTSDSPLKDALETLLAGPLPEEKKKGLDTLIPRDTTLLSVIVRGTTAYINLSEHFQFNTYGIEGYAAQLKQIVWTATEFPTVKDVQILIEGRRVDYLGSEGIFIGSPVSRDLL